MPMYGSMRHSPCGRKIKKKAAKGETFKKYTSPSEFVADDSCGGGYRRGDTSQYKSADSEQRGVCSAPEKHAYTGTLIKGISCMHKSNAVPVLNNQEIIDIARMRR